MTKEVQRIGQKSTIQEAEDLAERMANHVEYRQGAEHIGAENREQEGLPLAWAEERRLSLDWGWPVFSMGNG